MSISLKLTSHSRSIGHCTCSHIATALYQLRQREGARTRYSILLNDRCRYSDKKSMSVLVRSQNQNQRNQKIFFSPFQPVVTSPSV